MIILTFSWPNSPSSPKWTASSQSSSNSHSPTTSPASTTQKRSSSGRFWPCLRNRMPSWIIFNKISWRGSLTAGRGPRLWELFCYRTSTKLNRRVIQLTPTDFQYYFIILHHTTPPPSLRQQYSYRIHQQQHTNQHHLNLITLPIQKINIINAFGGLILKWMKWRP